MKVKELVALLTSTYVDQEAEVMLKHTDPTGWLTKIPLNTWDVDTSDDILSDDTTEDCDELFERDGNEEKYIGPKVVTFHIKY